MRLSGTLSVLVAGPVKVAPVKKSVHVPGGNHTDVDATVPGVVTGATKTFEPRRYSLSWLYASDWLG